MIALTHDLVDFVPMDNVNNAWVEGQDHSGVYLNSEEDELV